MFGFDWTGDGSVDFVDDLITLSMLGALDDEASDEDDEEDEDECECGDDSCRCRLFRHRFFF